ncbi:protein-disulfide reductase DsbD family protein [Pseudoduganella sp. SL102]|uniref:protein-disulfide reductase DsbD family protein n=1 Tax=Pseudoduganella sp. SL102 TaxID=2995154 RepID=UPI00248BA9DE|nr:thioredoxin family protein [Pseudoduganella sp. SL102]WBS03054.1 protein-disulfide reductase DsbD family protein [Pseudoduganella sp. SL102]
MREVTSLYKFAAASLLLSLQFAALPLAQAAGPVVVTDHVRSELLVHAPDGIRPGKTLWLGLAIDHQPHWHTYWKNPGDSGLATTLAWKLPAGFTAGEIAWPTPKKLPLGPLTNYGYENKVLLPVPVQVPAGFSGSELKIGLHAEWLVCKEICLPEAGDFELVVPAGAALAAHGALFDATRAATPVAPEGASATARVEDHALAIEVRGLPAPPSGEVQYFAEDIGVIDYAAKAGQQWADGTLRLRVPLSPQRSESPAVMKALLVVPGQPAGWTLSIPVEGPWPALGSAAPAPATSAAATTTTAPAPATSVAPAAATSFTLSLLFAFLGGALLNLMPCVFPVLSLKIFSLVQHRDQRGKAVAGGLAYTAGVVVSFVALAGLLLALRAGGAGLGWGFQLQSPLFVAGLAALFTLIGLNLAGVFEFGGVLPGALAAHRAKNPLVDDALSGALAVAVASPCTAPFMGAALGVALTEPAPRALAIFAVLGLGMAAPYLAVALVPALGRLLPRPGAWMVRFKVLMAFPMFATVVWLLWVLGQQTGIDAMAGVAGVLVALAFACWTIGTPVQSRRTRGLFAAAGVVVLAGAVHLAWPLLKAEPATAQAQASGDWAPWSVEAVGQARAAGKPVFIDFTAAWCITCQFNKRTVLNDAQLLKDFGARNVVLLRADWTRRDPAITEQLARLGRSGVPVYVLFGANDSQPPQVLSEVLTVEQVRAALGKIRPAPM